MKITVFPEENKVSIDGKQLIVDVTGMFAEDIRVIQWNNDTGHIEYKGHYKPNRTLDEFSQLQAIIDAFNAAKVLREQQEADRLAQIEAGLTYKQRRKREYPELIDQLEAIWDCLDPPDGSKAKEIKNQIQAIQAKYPKPVE